MQTSVIVLPTVTMNFESISGTRDFMEEVIGVSRRVTGSALFRTLEARRDFSDYSVPDHVLLIHADGKFQPSHARIRFS
jgi:hypothetical protein